jgi:hypothetical protein
LALGKGGRGTGRCGEDGREIGGIDFFLELRGGATGVALGDGEMQARFHSSIRCKIEETENIRRCAGTWGGAWTKRGRRYLTVTVVSKKTRRQWRIPTRDFISLAASRARGKEGDGGGGGGLFVGAVWRRIRQELKGIEEGRNLRDSVFSRLFRPEEEEDGDVVLLGGARCQPGEREGMVPVRVGFPGLFLLLGQKGSRGPFMFFLLLFFLFLFCFLISFRTFAL